MESPSPQIHYDSPTSDIFFLTIIFDSLLDVSSWWWFSSSGWRGRCRTVLSRGGVWWIRPERLRCLRVPLHLRYLSNAGFRAGGVFGMRKSVWYTLRSGVSNLTITVATHVRDSDVVVRPKSVLGYGRPLYGKDCKALFCTFSSVEHYSCLALGFLAFLALQDQHSSCEWESWTVAGDSKRRNLARTDGCGCRSLSTSKA